MRSSDGALMCVVTARRAQRGAGETKRKLVWLGSSGDDAGAITCPPKKDQAVANGSSYTASTSTVTASEASSTASPTPNTNCSKRPASFRRNTSI